MLAKTILIDKISSSEIRFGNDAIVQDTMLNYRNSTEQTGHYFAENMYCEYPNCMIPFEHIKNITIKTGIPGARASAYALSKRHIASHHID
jgi:hypothetical protein